VPYIGNPPAEKYASYDVQHITTSATSSYVLDKNVANENEIRVVLNNIIQQPGSSYAYTASGNTLTLSAATTSSDKLYVVFTGKAVQTVTPPPSSVGLAQFNATGSPGTNTFLRGDNSWATPSDTSLTLNNNAASRVVVGTGTTNTMDAQANLTFDGTQLSVLDTNAGTENLLVKTTGDNQISMGIEKSDLKFDIGLDHNNDGSQNFFIRERHQGGGNTNAVRMLIDSSGNVGIGETAPLGKLHVKVSDTSGSVSANADNLVLEENGNVGLTMLSANNGTGHIFFGNGGDQDEGFITYDSDNNRMRFGINGQERFRVLGNGTMNFNDTGFTNTKNEWFIKLLQNTNDSATNYMIDFANSSNTSLGSIKTNGTSSTSFNTSSDYRLKENVDYNFDATTRLKQLKPARFNFISDENNTLVDGFLAHEVSNIVPEAISGKKDAMYPEVLYTDAVLYTAEDELPEGISIGDVKTPADKLPEGKNFGDVKEETKINPQQIDQSKLVPLLVKTIQELEARIKTLENA